jgi:hypothetical protein
MIHRSLGAGTALLALVLASSVQAADWYGQSYGSMLPTPMMGYFGTGYRPHYPVPNPQVQRQHGNHAYHSNRIAPHMDPYSANRRYTTIPANFSKPYVHSRSFR